MRYASIDLGTNTLRLLIAEPADGLIKPVFYTRKITRLGGNYAEEAGIDPESAERTFSALEEFKRHIDEYGVTEVMAFATSVVRRARNRDWFSGEVKKRAGIDITVITGGTEARLSLLGVLSVLEQRNGKKLVIDIGGGSTEFIATDGTEMKGGWSMEMGVVHLTEKYLRSDPPDAAELDGIEQEVKSVLRELKSRMRKDGVDPDEFSGQKGAVFVGTAGTITTLAAIDQDLEAYDRNRINNYRIKKERVEAIYKRLAGLCVRERERVLNMEKGREDLIIPGSAITLLTMEAFGFGSAVVSDAGLLEGILIDKVSGTGFLNNL